MRKFYFFLIHFLVIISIPVISCDLGSDIPVNIKQTVVSATATSTYTGYEIEKTFDGNTATYYNSAYGVNPFPLTLNYNFSGVDEIDYLVYTPRPGTNPVGNLQQCTIWYSTTATPTTFVKLCDYNFNAPIGAIRFDFPVAIANPRTIRFVVSSGTSSRATCAEMEFYKSVSLSQVNSAIFTDNICSGIKPTVTQSDIDGMTDGFYKNLAQCMFNGTYSSTSRLQQYEPYLNPTSVASALKIGGLSPFENPTGIWFDAETTAVVFVEDTYGQAVSLKVYDFSSKTNVTYPLSTGTNAISITSKGLGYINYYTDDYASLQAIKIHIPSGIIHGYYDVNKTTADQWRAMIANPATNMIDLKGNRVFLHFPVSYLKQYSPLDAKALVQIYDTIIQIEFERMGLYKYNKVPKNHAYGEATDEDASWWGGTIAHFGGGLNTTCDPIAIRAGCWGIAHEFGHTHVLSPGLKWKGMTETTNNMHSAQLQYTFTPNYAQLECKVKNDAYYDGYDTGTGLGKGNSIAGGWFNAYLNNGVLKGAKHLWQYGADNMSNVDWEYSGGDHFVRLIPFWQLQLYYQYAHSDKKDWYGDLCETIRNSSQTDLSNGTLILNFIKNTCDIVQENLTGFFIKAGILRTQDREINDYGLGQITITTADSAAVIDYVQSKGYPQPDSPVMNYISKHSIAAYKNHLAVVGGNVGVGCVASAVDPTDGGYKNYITVDHAVWKNVTVFETYKANTIVRLSMVGSGYADNSKTRVYYPTGATSIYAVAWNGTKTLVYGTGVTQGVYTESMDDIDSTKLILYPNPVTDTFRVSGIKGIATLKVTDLCGRHLFTKKVTNNEDVSVSSLNKGINIVEITTINNSVLVKLERY